MHYHVYISDVQIIGVWKPWKMTDVKRSQSLGKKKKTNQLLL